MSETTAAPHSSELKSSLRSAWILGVLSSGFGIQLFIRFGLNALPQWQKPLEFLAVFGWIIPGLMIATSAIYLKRSEPWAVTMAKVTTAWQILIGSCFLIAQFFLTPITAVPLVMNFLWIAALMQFFWQLGNAGRTVRFIRAEQWRGFEVLDSQSNPLVNPVMIDREGNSVQN